MEKYTCEICSGDVCINKLKTGAFSTLCFDDKYKIIVKGRCVRNLDLTQKKVITVEVSTTHVDHKMIRGLYNLEQAPYPKLDTKPLLNRKVFKAARVSILEFPFVVSIRRKMAHYLVGTILTKNVVVTVAHPLYKVPVYDLKVVAGENYSDRGTTLYTVVVAIFHEDFDPYTLENDLALLRLRSSMSIKNSIKFIAPLAPGVPILSNIGFVVGWGRCDRTGRELCIPRSTIYHPGEIQDIILRSIKFLLKPSRYCYKYEQLHLKLLPGMMCIGRSREERAAFPCIAVPGAPLVVFGKLAGLQSWGFGCGYEADLPLIYTNVQHYIRWIDHNVLVLSSLTAIDFNPFYIATMAYTLVNNLRDLRKMPAFDINGNFTLVEYPVLDQVLAKTHGKVYDMRDFVFNGTFSETKQGMMEYIRTLYERKTVVEQNTLSKILPIPIPFLNETNVLFDHLIDNKLAAKESDSEEDMSVVSDYDEFNYFA